MTKEQEAVKRCNKLIETEHSNWIGISNQKAIETVLNMLKEKDAEIEKYKQLYYILSRQNARIEHDNMEKDKMIDLMSEELIGHIFEDAYVKFDEEDIKQYFERKAEQSSSINKTPEKN